MQKASREMPVVLFCEHIAESIEREFATHATIAIAAEPKEDAIIATHPRPDAIVIRAKGTISRRVIEAFPTLRVIGRHGIGVDHIDLVAAREHGIWVLNTPEANTEATAEHTMGLLLAVLRHIVISDHLVRSEEPWTKADGLVGRNLEGKTLGVIGVGRTGTRVATIAARGFGMKIVYSDYKDRHNPALVQLGGALMSVDDLVAIADVVTLHVPLAPSTVGLLTKRHIESMKPSTIVINTSRGAVIDEDALVAALSARRLRGAGLDVMAREPLINSPLQGLTNTVLTPHLASYTDESFAAMGAVVWDVMRVLNGERPQWVVVDPTA